MTDKTRNEPQTDQVTFTFPRTLKVSGARGLTRTLDLQDATPEKILALVDYAFGVITQRAGASEDGFNDKVKAEQDKADQLVRWEWSPGQGGGSRIDEREAATRRLLIPLFTSLGMKKADATKAAKAEDRWHQYFGILLESQGHPHDEETVAKTVEEQSDAIEALVQKEIEEERKRKEREAKLKETPFDLNLKVGE